MKKFKFIFYCSILTFTSNLIFASDEVQITADQIFFDNSNNIVNASGDVLIESDELKINSENASFEKQKNPPRLHLCFIAVLDSE